MFPWRFRETILNEFGSNSIGIITQLDETSQTEINYCDRRRINKTDAI